MSAIVASNSTKYWKWVFLVLEAVVLLPFLVWELAERFLRIPLDHVSDSIGVVLGGAYLGAWLFLLIVSPFFLRSLRWVALAGWIIAFGLLILGSLMPAL